VGEAADGGKPVGRVRDLRPDVVVLGLGSPSIRNQALSLGADAYVEKGADLDELRSAVADAGRRKVALRSGSAGA
jgi:DNA-binding NarL/FixJ family response regulator